MLAVLASEFTEVEAVGQRTTQPWELKVFDGGVSEDDYDQIKVSTDATTQSIIIDASGSLRARVKEILGRALKAETYNAELQRITGITSTIEDELYSVLVSNPEERSDIISQSTEVLQLQLRKEGTTEVLAIESPEDGFSEEQKSDIASAIDQLANLGTGRSITQEVAGIILGKIAIVIIGPSGIKHRERGEFKTKTE